MLVILHMKFTSVIENIPQWVVNSSGFRNFKKFVSFVTNSVHVCLFTSIALHNINSIIIMAMLFVSDLVLHNINVHILTYIMKFDSYMTWLLTCLCALIL